MSRSSLARSSIAPLPCETRLTVIPSVSAARSTASSTRGPSTLGISRRNAAPSGKAGSRFWPVTPSPSNISPTHLIRPHSFFIFWPNEPWFFAVPKSIL